MVVFSGKVNQKKKIKGLCLVSLLDLPKGGNVWSSYTVGTLWAGTKVKPTHVSHISTALCTVCCVCVVKGEATVAKLCSLQFLWWTVEDTLITESSLEHIHVALCACTSAIAGAVLASMTGLHVDIGLWTWQSTFTYAEFEHARLRQHMT